MSTQQSKSMKISAYLVTTAYTEVINLIKHMSATHNYRKYVTPSLSTYLWFSHYSRTHNKRNLGTSSSVFFPGYSLTSTPPSCHRGRRAGATGVDEGVPDLAPARVQIWSVMTGAVLGRGSRSSLYRRQGCPSAVS